MDLFVVPTIGFDLLYGLVIVRLDRRDLVWINVTANPTAEWVAHQALDQDAPGFRPVERTGVVRSRTILGGLHHHYARA
jgi:hypothetical protein